MLGLVGLCHTDTFIYAGRPSCMYEAWSLTWLKIITGLFLYIFWLPIRSVKSKGLIKFRGFSAQRQIRVKIVSSVGSPFGPLKEKIIFFSKYFRPDDPICRNYFSVGCLFGPLLLKQRI